MARCGHIGSGPCGREWTSLIAAHCSECHEHFSSGQGFDAHRMYGKCRQPGKLKGWRLMRREKRADGPVWVLIGDPEMDEGSS